jgi:ribosome biogenesis GTPase / thiamine phosphate phosphatase
LLERLGWDDEWAAARLAADASLQPVRIVAEHRGAYHASDGDTVAWVELTGKSYHRAADKRALPTVGDWVLVEHWDRATSGGGAGVIRHVLPRRGLLVRKAAGEATQPQPLAANVDRGLVLTSANKDLSPARLDRYLALLRDGGIAPVLVLSKIDLADPEPLLAALRERGAPVIGISVVTGAGLDEIRALAGPGTTLVLLGSSGVGKSSLLNAIVGDELQRTQQIKNDERGKHTTTHRQLFVTPHGLWIDTPGMRELAQFIDDQDLVFDDIDALAPECKFRDCQHRAEPGCAVRDAVPADRLASFHKLLDERSAGARKQEAASRIAETRKAKAKKYAPRPGKPDDD